MECDHQDEHGGRLPAGSKSNFHDDELQNNSVLSTSAFQHTAKIHKILLLFPFFIDVHIKEVQADVKKSFQNIKNPPGSDINNAYPVRVQLPTNHLKTSHITDYKATHRHRKISQSSTSTSTLSHLSLKAPVE
ncbi:hypothetical protein cypCar_00003119, partial [Cyprinus carpio]